METAQELFIIQEMELFNISESNFPSPKNKNKKNTVKNFLIYLEMEFSSLIIRNLKVLS